MNLRALFDSAIRLHQKGKFAEAESHCQQILAIDLSNFSANNLLGIIRFQQGRNGEALELIATALAKRPTATATLLTHGLVLESLQRFEEALASFDRALALKPDYALALNNRGNTLQSLNRFQDAVASYDRALAIAPDNADTLCNRGTALEGLRHFADALACYDKAIAARPDHAQAFLARGIVLKQLNRPGEAVRSYDHALILRPDFFDAYFHRGLALHELGHGEEAIASYDKAISLRPDSFSAINNRCGALLALRRYTEAVQGYRRLDELAPGNALALNGLAGCAIQLCDWPNQKRFLESLREQVAQKSPHIKPGILIGYSDDPALLLACAHNMAAEIKPPAGPPLRRGKPFSSEKIRIAYCSANFNAHPVPRLLAGMFENHDRSRFEVVAISFSIDDKSELRARLVKAFDQFHDALDSSDYDIAALIADLGIDIAIDLMGYTGRARTGIFALRPAPIQVNYMGYTSTTASPYHDYIIGDPVVLPMGHQPFYTENIVQLPDTFYGTDGTRNAAGPAPSRAQAGLPGQGFVFCCFNNNWKITQPQFDIWMRLLAAVPGSVLWLLQDNLEVADSLKRHAVERGIAPERLVFASRVTQAEHLARHRLADLFLDTLPYNAHTTACDSLWVGVPLVTCVGRNLYARVAASVLCAIGLPELVTDTLSDYESLALALARDSVRLSALRRKLESIRLVAPLFDTKRFTRNMEAAFTGMRDIWLRGEVPHGFLADPQ